MVLSERVEIRAVHYLMRLRIGEAGVMLSQANCSFINCVCRLVDKVKGLSGVCIRFCCHVEEPAAREVLYVNWEKGGVDVKLRG